VPYHRAMKVGINGWVIDPVTEVYDIDLAAVLTETGFTPTPGEEQLWECLSLTFFRTAEGGTPATTIHPRLFTLTGTPVADEVWVSGAAASAIAVGVHTTAALRLATSFYFVTNDSGHLYVQVRPNNAGDTWGFRMVLRSLEYAQEIEIAA